MTTQEAISTLKRLRYYLFCASEPECVLMDFDMIQALLIAERALQKQVPIKPYEIDEDYNYYVCPCCKETIYSTSDLADHKYCLHCGQRIDWSGINVYG